MPYRLLTTVLFVFICILAQNVSFAQSAKGENSILPSGISYDSSVPTPHSVLGHEVGEWHVTHDKLVQYFIALDAASDKVSVETIGHTYESRPLLNVTITSPNNHQRLEQIRQEHKKLSDPYSTAKPDVSNMPVVIRLGYSVHGNEASGSNASLAVAYHLAAAEDEWINTVLDNSVILIDPSLNPDGMQRFASWVNANKSMSENSDQNNMEFQEPWPNGRTNHYWFDLNRDWILAQHPESIARLKVYHDWMPNIQTDHHEMGSDATFFFQPGVPSRNNPLIPGEIEELTARIGQYHAEALDSENRLYFTKEMFDDFYFGKGSTYPDIQGAVGILFEQASVRGHARETKNGVLTFPYAIKNHFISSFSTIKAGIELRTELLEFQQSFFEHSISDDKKVDNSGIMLRVSRDKARLAHLAASLQRHDIDIYSIQGKHLIEGREFNQENSFIVPYNQPQRTLIHAMFDRQLSFEGSLFYDVSAWDFDLAYNVEKHELSDLQANGMLGNKIESIQLPTGQIHGEGEYAFVMPWDQYYAPAVLYSLLEDNYKMRVATETFTSAKGIEIRRGDIVLLSGLQDSSPAEIRTDLSGRAEKYHVQIHAIASGLATSGVDLGSDAFKEIRQPKMAMIVGRGASSYETGEVWHLLDQRYDMKLTKITTETLDRIDIASYNVLILPGASYSTINASSQMKIKEWVKHGGTLIAWRDALRFVAKLQIADIRFKPASKDSTRTLLYADRENARGAQKIGGAIFNIKLDTTHPLAYGYDQTHLAVFKRGSNVIHPAKKSVSNPFVYSETPLVSGYSSRENVARIKGTPAVSVSTYGRGKIIGFVDNHNFRAFWYGTNRLFINSVFFGNQISTTQ